MRQTCQQYIGQGQTSKKTRSHGVPSTPGCCSLAGSQWRSPLSLEPKQTNRGRSPRDTPTRLRWIDGTFVECKIILLAHIRQKMIVHYILFPIEPYAKNHYSSPARKEDRRLLRREELGQEVLSSMLWRCAARAHSSEEKLYL